MSNSKSIDQIRKDFPLLNQKIHGKTLVYLDNAATTQKPYPVLEASRHYYEKINANIHRAAHYLGQEATRQYEESRSKIAKHLNVKNQEIIFTSGCTNSINLVASILENHFQKGDEILLTTLEHHSNIVPWQLLSEKIGTKIKVVPLQKNGSLNLEELQKLLTPKVKLFAFTHISNAFGIINPIQELIKKAKSIKALTLIDGAQATPHLPLDLKAMGCDFYAFSGHKMYASTGIGILYGREKLLQKLPPYQGGGEMIKEVSFTKTTYNDPPLKYEAGTPNIEGAISLAKAMEYMHFIGLEWIAKHETNLRKYAIEQLAKIPEISIYGKELKASGAISFQADKIHPFDLGTLLDKMGIAVRTGHHCCQPLMQHYKIQGTVRISFALYNTEKEIDKLIEGIKKSLTILK